MMGWQATATWWAPVAVLCVLGCRQNPDVVAQISRASVEPKAGSTGAGSGAGTGAGGNAGTAGIQIGASGSGGTAGGGSGGSGGSGGNGGNGGEQPPVQAGSPATGTAGRAPTAPPCPLADFYPEVVEFTESDCLLRQNLSPGLWFFITFVLRPVPLMGETREPAPCERANIGVETTYDENRVPMTRLCINLCDGARAWLVNTREANACLEDAFPPDAGTGP